MINNFQLNIVDFGMVYSGKNIQTEYHTHYATVIVLSEQLPFTIKTETNTYQTRCCLLPSNYQHQFLSKTDDFFTLIYLEPTHEYGRKIRQVYCFDKELISLEEHFQVLSPLVKSIYQKEIIEVATVQKIIQAVIGESSHLVRMDDRINHSIELINTKLSDKLSLSDIAKLVHLSESRFAHLFKAEIGVPFRKFVRWKRLKEAGQLILKGHSFTRACLQAGFSDSAHFTKTCQEMFGISPSKVIKF